MYVETKAGQVYPANKVLSEHVECLINGSVQPLRKDKIVRFIGSKNMHHDDFNKLAELRRTA